jgi:hypothetical protein
VCFSISFSTLSHYVIDPHKSESGDITGYNRALIFMPDGMEYSFEEVRASKYAYPLLPNLLYNIIV